AVKLELAFDHNMILETAINKMYERLLTSTIAQQFLDNEGFTLRELHKLLTDVVPGFQLDETNFSKKLLSTKGREGLIYPVDKKERRYSGPKAQLYKMNSKLENPLTIFNSF